MRPLGSKIMSWVLALALLVPLLPTATPARAANPDDFVDFPAGSWCEDAFRWGVEAGVIYGRTETRIDPWATAKRSEFAALLNRVFGTYRRRSLDNFTDMTDPGQWHYPEFEMAYQMRSIQGTSSTTMSPDQTVTREQAITAISRVLCLPLQDDPAAALGRYKDVVQVAPWALPHVAAM